MKFIADKQTLEDLNILGEFKSNSIFSLFCRTNTYGAKKILDIMFHNPLSDVEEINKRANIFEFFKINKIAFPIHKSLFEEVEKYLSTRSHKNYLISITKLFRLKFLNVIAKEMQYEILYNGLIDTIKFFGIIREFNDKLKTFANSALYQKEIEKTDEILNNKLVKSVTSIKDVKSISFGTLMKYDYILRSSGYELMNELIEIIYYTDIYTTVSQVAIERGLTKAEALPAKDGHNIIEIKDMFHPQLPNAVSNDLKIDYEKNVIFLTGANMAGKSTLMKSFGIAVFMGQLGFPVAAKYMRFSVQDGLFSSINVSDNMTMGYSHFYAEVLRVKNVAESVSEGNNLVVIFDELFKGTNVKDAYDATVGTVEAFSENKNCSFIISTHITEAGEELREKCNNFKFVYLPTIMQKSIPRYTYKLADGISEDRHGMMIIRNEKIIEIINGNGIA